LKGKFLEQLEPGSPSGLSTMTPKNTGKFFSLAVGLEPGDDVAAGQAKN
jgi:hypothetical protein